MMVKISEGKSNIIITKLKSVITDRRTKIPRTGEGHIRKKTGGLWTLRWKNVYIIMLLVAPEMLQYSSRLVSRKRRQS